MDIISTIAIMSIYKLHFRNSLKCIGGAFLENQPSLDPPGIGDRKKTLTNWNPGRIQSVFEETCSPDRLGSPLRSNKQRGMRSLSIFKQPCPKRSSAIAGDIDIQYNTSGK